MQAATDGTNRFNIVNVTTGQVVGSAATSIGAETAALNLSAAAMSNAQKKAVGLQAAMGWISLVLALVVPLIMKFVDSVETTAERVEKANEAYESAKSELEGINTELQTATDRMNELSRMPSLTFAEQGELQRLKDLTAELKAQQKIKEAQIKLKEDAVFKEEETLFKEQYGRDSRVTGEGIDEEKGKERVSLGGLESNKADIELQIATYEKQLARKKELEDKILNEKDEDSLLLLQQNLKISEQFIAESNDNILEGLSAYQAKYDRIMATEESDRTRRFGANWQKQVDDLKYSINTMWATIDEEKGKELKLSKILDEDDFQSVKKKLDGLTGNAKDFVKELEKPEYALFVKAFGDVGLSVEEVAAQFAKAAEEAKLAAEDFTGLADTMSLLADKSNLIKSVNKDIEEFGIIQSGTIKSIMEKYPQLTDELVKYQLGLRSNAEIINDLQGAYDVDYKNFKELAKTKLYLDGDFYHNALKNKSEEVKQINEAYDIDLTNFKNAESAKLKLQATVLSQMVTNQSEYVGMSIESMEEIATGMSPLANDPLLRNILRAVREAEKRLDGLVFDSFDFEVDFSPEKFELEKGKDGAGKETDLYLEAYNKEYAELKHLRAMDEINDQQYHDRLTELDSRYFTGKEKYIDNHKKNLEELHSLEQSLYAESFDKEYTELKHLRAIDEINDQQYHDKLTELDVKYFANKEKYIDNHKKNLEELYSIEKTISDGRIADIEHENYLLSQRGDSGATAKTEIANLKKIQLEYHKLAESRRKDLRSLGVSEKDIEIDDIVQELQKKWWSAENNITSLGKDAYEDRLAISEKYIEERNYHNDWGTDNEISAWNRVLEWLENDYYKTGLIDYKTFMEEKEKILHNSLEAQKRALENQKKELENQQSIMDSQISGVTDYIDEEIKKLEEEKTALEDSNKEREKAITLSELEEKLRQAKANRSVRIYRKGVGFTYEQDTEAVKAAEKELEDFKFQEQVNEIDKQIKAWEKYKEEWQSIPNAFQKEQDRLNAAQITANIQEAKNWEERIAIAKAKKDEYNSILQQIQSINDAIVSAGSSGGGGGSSGGGGSGGGGNTIANIPGKGNTWIDVTHDEAGGGSSQSGLPIGTVVKGDNYDYHIVDKDTPGAKYNKDSGYYSVAVKHAKGTKNSGTELANVDELGDELIGRPSKGRYTMLEKGSWVLPHEETNNIFNFAKNPTQFFQNYLGEKSLQNPLKNYQPPEKQNQSSQITFGDIILQGVQDVNGFARAIETTLKSKAINLSFNNS
ncbi:MAG: hypothetical protein RSB38_04770 [Oscillospiraceae bacterium]